MKIKLLNDGGYSNMENLDYTQPLKASRYGEAEDGKVLVTVMGADLIANGALRFDPENDYSFWVGTECVIVEE